MAELLVKKISLEPWSKSGVSLYQTWNRVSSSRVTVSAILVGSGRVVSRVSVSDPVFDPVLSFNTRVYRGVVSTE